MGRSASEIEDDTEQQETDQDEYLARGHPELDFSEERDAENVDSHDNDDNNRAFRFGGKNQIWPKESLDTEAYHQTAALIFFSGSQN